MSSSTPSFDLAAAHRFFSADCYNRAFGLMENPSDTVPLVACAQASLYHWLQRPDCTNLNLSIGYWQVSRVYAVCGQAENALRYGQLCLTASEGEPPFYQGFAYEALARAAKLAGDTAALTEHLATAHTCAAQVADAEERQMLEADLATLA